MRKLILAATLALTAMLTLSACNKQDDAEPTAQQVQQVAKPTDPNDAKAWNTYLGQIVSKNMDGMTADQPYPYLVNAGDNDEDKAKRDRQLQNVQDTVARGVLPGNMLVFAGPDSGKTADLIVDAFKGAKPGSFKDVIVLFIGEQTDRQRVDAVLQPTGAKARFVQM